MSRFGRIGGAAARVADATTPGGVGVPESNIAQVLLAQKYSNLLTGTGGVSPAGNARFDFFQDKRSPLVTNIYSPGKLVQHGYFDAHALTFSVDVDSGENMIDDDLTASDLAEAIRKILNRGFIEMRKGQKVLLEAFGLCNFPQGGGPVVNGYGSTTATTTSFVGANITNGVQQADNMRWFPSPIRFTADDSVSLNVDFGSVINPGTGIVLRMQASLWGREITDAIR